MNLESEVYSEPKEFDEQKEGDNNDRIDVNFCMCYFEHSHIALTCV